MPTLEELVVELRADIGGYRRELRIAEGATGQSARRMEREASGLAGAFGKARLAVGALGAGIAALGAGAALTSLVRLTRDAIDQAGKLSDLSEQVGLTAERYQELAFGLRNTGGEVGALQTGLAVFSRQLAELRLGTGTLFEFLKKADPEFAGLLEGTTSNTEALDLFADRVAALSDQTDRLALSQAGFGRGGREFVNLLSRGSAGVAELSAQARELGAVISDETVQAGDELADAFGNLGDVLRARFTEAAIGAQDSGRSLLETLTDPRTVREVGELAEGVGQLAGALVRLAAAAGRVAGRMAEAVREIRAGAGAVSDFARFDQAIAEAERRKTAEAELGPLEAGASVTLSAAERARFGIGAPRAPQSAGFSPPPDAGGGSKGKRSSAERDPLATALESIRLEVAALESLGEARARFEDEVTRDLANETATREELVQRWAEGRIAELERLGFAEEEAAALRVKIEQTADARIAEVRQEGLEGLARIAEVGFETVGDFLASRLLDDSEQTFGQLVQSFARTLLRMQLAAAASGIGDALRAQFAGAGAAPSGSSSGGGFGGFLGSLLSGVFRFADGGVVRGPTLGLIGEDPGTRPELVMPLDRFRELREGDGAGEIRVVNTAPEVRASARRVGGRSGRSAFEIQLESTFLSLLGRGAFRDQLGGRHAPGMR